MRHQRTNGRRGLAGLLTAMILLPMLSAPIQIALAEGERADNGKLKRNGIELIDNAIVLESDTLTWEETVHFTANTASIDLPEGLTATNGAQATLTASDDTTKTYQVDMDVQGQTIKVDKPDSTPPATRMPLFTNALPPVETIPPEPEQAAPAPPVTSAPESNEPEQTTPPQEESEPETPTAPPQTAPTPEPETTPAPAPEPEPVPEPAPEPERPAAPEAPNPGIDPEALISAAVFSLVPHAAAAEDSYILSVPCKVDRTKVTDGAITINGIDLKISALQAPTMEILKKGADNKYTPLKNTGEQISLQDTLALKVNWDKLTGVVIGQPYEFTFPKELGVADVAITDQVVPLTGYKDVMVAKFTVLKGSNVLSITFQEVKGQSGAPTTETQYVTNVYLQFDCKLQEDQLNANDQGDVKIQLPGGKEVTITVTEKMPNPPKLKKETDSQFTEDGIVTWNIKYTPATGAYTGKVPTQLKDTLPEGMEYVTKPLAIDPAPTATITPIVDATTNTLTIPLPQDSNALTPGTEYTLSYKTKITAEKMLKVLGQKGTIAFENTVQGYKDADTPIENLKNSATANLPNNWPGRTPLSKDGSKLYIKNDEYYIDWTILVNTASQSFTKLIVKDTLGIELSLVKDSVKIKTKAGDITNTITVTSEGEENQPKKIFFELIPDGTAANKVIAAASQYTITYTTKVKPDYFQHTGSVTEADVTNTATLEWAWPTGITGTPPTPPTIEKGPGNIDGLDNTLISKSAVGYDYTTRALKWRVTINPHQVDLQAMTLTEDLDGVTPAHSFTKSDTNDATVTLDAAKDAILKALNAALSQNTVDTTAMSEFTNKKMTLVLPAIGKKKLSFDYVTYVDDPAVWANNDQKTFVNKITATDIKVGTTALNKAIPAEAKQNVTVTVLQKATTHYDPATKQITWKLVVNSSGVPLTDVSIEDTLPPGLHYVEGSANLDDASFADTNIEDTGSTLTFNLGDRANKKKVELTYKTSINSTEVDDFLTKETVSFLNKAKLASMQYPSGVSVEHTFELKNQPLTKEAPTSLTNNNKVTYTVKLNPLGIKLLQDETAVTKLSLTDTLSPGLYPDIDSVSVTKGVINAGSGNPYDPVMTAGVTVNTAQIRYESAKNTITIENLDDETPYYITYDAYATRTGVQLNNSVSLFGSRMPVDSTLDQSDHNLQFIASGGATFGMPPSFFSIQVTKVNADGQPIGWTNSADAAEFGLYKDSACTKLISSGPTASTGVWMVGLPKNEANDYGKLYIKELKAPPGYEKNPNPIEIDVATVAYKLCKIEMVNIGANVPQDAKITIKKIDSANSKALSGVTFGLYSDPDAQSSALQKQTTGTDGLATFTDLYPGSTYYVKELQAPDTHVVDPAVYPVEAGTGDTVEIKNAKAEAVIKIKKVRDGDETTTLAGAAFKLFTDVDGTTQKGSEQVTGTDGVATFTGLQPNTIYYLMETKAPTGYEGNDKLLNKLVKVETGENKATKEITITNKKILVSIKAVKVRQGKEEEKLPGASFELYESDKHTLVGTAQTTDDKGETTFTGLEPNTTYWLKETTTPKGYRTPQNVWTAVETKDFTDTTPKEVQIANDKIMVPLHVIKEGDGADKPRLPGAKLALYAADKATLVRQAQTTDDKGETTFTDLEPETTYYIRETEAPKGYRIKNEWTKVQTGAFDAAQPADVTVVNEKILVGIRVIKVRQGDPDTKLQGAEFELYSDAEGKNLLRAAQTTDENGITEFLNLQPETTYYLKETQAPSGYRILSDELIAIQTGEGVEGAQPVEQTVENVRRRSHGGDSGTDKPKDPPKPEEPVGPTDPVDPDHPVNPDDPAKPADPADPADPDAPADPSDPSKPGGTNDPGQPGGSGQEQGTDTVPSGSTASGASGTGHSSGSRVSSIPETGVQNRIPLWALGLAGSLGLAAVLCLSQLLAHPKGKHVKKRG